MGGTAILNFCGGRFVQFTSLEWRRRSHPIIAGLILLVSNAAANADSYDSAAKLLNIPSMVSGVATFSTVVVSPNAILCVGSGTPNGQADTYAPVTGQLFIPSVTVAGTAYSNVQISVASLMSIGSVTGADVYNGGELVIPSVQVDGGMQYNDVTVEVGDIISTGGGLPENALDEFDTSNGQLTIAAVQVGSKVYTNAIVTVAKIVSVGSSRAARINSHAASGTNASCSIEQLGLEYAALPANGPTGLFVPVGGAGYISVIAENLSSQDYYSIKASASTGAAQLPLAIAMCLTSVAGLDCPVAPTSTLTIPIIPPAVPPENSESPLIELQVSASAPVASNAANTITIVLTNPGGTVLGSVSVPVTASVLPVGIAVATESGNGIVVVPVGQGQQGAFVVAAQNEGAALSGTTVSTSTKLPIGVTLCQTTGSGQCVGPPATSVLLPTLASDASVTFSCFVSSATALPSDPAANLLFINFESASGTLVGSASVEVATN